MGEEKPGPSDPAASDPQKRQPAADEVQPPDMLEPGEDICPQCGGRGRLDTYPRFATRMRVAATLGQEPEVELQAMA